MKRALLLTALIVYAATELLGQATRVDFPIQTSGPNVPSTPGPLPQALWVANATAYLCAHVTPYSSQTLANCQQISSLLTPT